ncbi:MAG: DUF4956 domain-containing protein [Bacillota bacterium]|nr:DUF4956 domain-containing protein [Bacillota bacterium]
MTFNDIFKSSFLNRVSAFSFMDSVIALGTAFLVGMFIYLVYKKTFAGVMYSRPFNISLVALTMLVTFVILAVTSDVVLSLGMVGALSIVRFRTAIKDPLDLVFLFWSVGAGIVVGAGLIPLAVAGSVAIGLLLITFAARTALETPYILIINCADAAAEDNATALVRTTVRRHQVKSKTVTAGKGIELIFEVRMKDALTGFVNELSTLSGVSNAVLVSYNGDYAA